MARRLRLQGRQKELLGGAERRLSDRAGVGRGRSGRRKRAQIAGGNAARPRSRLIGQSGAGRRRSGISRGGALKTVFVKGNIGYGAIVVHGDDGRFFIHMNDLEFALALAFGQHQGEFLGGAGGRSRGSGFEQSAFFAQEGGDAEQRNLGSRGLSGGQLLSGRRRGRLEAEHIPPGDRCVRALSGAGDGHHAQSKEQALRDLPHAGQPSHIAAIVALQVCEDFAGSIDGAGKT